MKRRKYLLWSVPGLALLVLLSGVPVQAEAPAQAKAQAQVNQAQMVEKIRSALLKLPYYGVFDYLEFSIDGRTVTLNGYATRTSLKKDAQAAVHEVKGVEEVVNNIQILPLSPADDRIRRALFRSIYGTPALQRYAIGPNPPIHIIVSNGNVKLEGVVPNENDKNIAGIQARGVGGTFKVENNLHVESESAKAE
ncbi:MAG: BON domain-containing protein [Acidobacteria bacterium]|nr:MAG: BON domain-containing protein [Acidobacteriota bacterium]RPJ61999.1 MAG: BON domain-containing protein [Acidobacteriota bacterium]